MICLQYFILKKIILQIFRRFKEWTRKLTFLLKKKTAINIGFVEKIVEDVGKHYVGIIKQEHPKVI